MIWCSKKNWENYIENAFEQKKKKPGLIFNHWSALIGLRITGPWRVMNINSYNMSSLLAPRLTTAICHYFITTNNVFITAERHPSSMPDVSLSNLVKWQLQLLGLKKVVFKSHWLLNVSHKLKSCNFFIIFLFLQAKQRKVNWVFCHPLFHCYHLVYTCFHISTLDLKTRY